MAWSLVTILACLLVAAIVVVVVGIVLYVILGPSLFNLWARKAVSASYACLTDGDCHVIHGLGSNWVCDPDQFECRVKAYVARSCLADTDCLGITPNCIVPPGLAQTTVRCSQIPYHSGDLYGDPGNGGCAPGFGVNKHYNICQAYPGNPCSTDSACLYGVCRGGTCEILNPYDRCPVYGRSYADSPCGPSLYCAPAYGDNDPKAPTGHCQPAGVTPGATGAFCLTGTDCASSQCYFEFPGAPFGICAGAVGLIGMPCTLSGDCTYGLDCAAIAGYTGTCVFADPTKQTIANHCPTQYSGVVVGGTGCVGGVSPVPCLYNAQCASECSTSTLNPVSNLQIGILAPNQTWLPIYPIANTPDSTGFFTDVYNIDSANGYITLKPNMQLLVSPFEMLGGSITLYPPVTVRIAHTPPNPPLAPVTELRACQQTSSGIVQLSSFSSLTTNNVIFSVFYDQTNTINSYIGILFTNPGFNQGVPVYKKVTSSELFTYSLSTKPHNTPDSQILIPRNYHGFPADRVPYPMTQGDGKDVPGPWQGRPVFLIPPPTMQAKSGAYTAYMSSSVRIDNNLPIPPQIYAHFFYYPTGSEQVSWSRFQTLPTQNNGGLITLIGYFAVGSRLIMSTYALFLQAIGSVVSRFNFAVGSNPDPAYGDGVLSPVLQDVSSGLELMGVVYSTVVIDGVARWPFNAKVRAGPNYAHDAAGGCYVSYASQVAGTWQMKNMTDSVITVPGYATHGNTYQVFTPRAYTRIQAVSPGVDWSAAFDCTAPSGITVDDADTVILGGAGSHVIAGIAVSMVYYNVWGVAPAQTTRHTLIITMRFGDTLTSSLYSREAAAASGQMGPIGRSYMFTFYLTPDIEEVGGALVAGGVPITPGYSVDCPTDYFISSWQTLDMPQQNGSDIGHATRAIWGEEVFTVSVVPDLLGPPVRFLKVPSRSSLAGSTYTPVDIFIWGRPSLYPDPNVTDAVFVQLFFDRRGLSVSTYQGSTWVSGSTTQCPPTSSAETTTIQSSISFTQTNGQRWQPSAWQIIPTPALTRDPVDTAWLPQIPLPLNVFMCETQGYPDGVIYRARPLMFLDSTRYPNGDTTLPATILTQISTYCQVVPGSDIEPMAVCMCTPGPGASDPPLDFKVTTSQIGIEAPARMAGTPGAPARFTHTVLKDFLKGGSTLPSGIVDRALLYVSSEGSVTPVTPGTYRTAPCPVIPGALPYNSGYYPTTCPDASLAFSSITSAQESVPILMAFQDRKADGSALTSLYMYTLKGVPGPGETVGVQLVMATLIPMNGGLVNGYGGVGGVIGNCGSPVVAYSTCM